MTDCERLRDLLAARVEGIHGLRLVTVSDDPWVCKVLFANATTGVEFQWEDRLLVLLGPIVDGRLSAPPGEVTPTTRYGAHYLDALIALHGGDVGIGTYQRSENDEEAWRSVTSAIDALVDALQQYGGALLAGDFSIFEELDAAARARAMAQREL